MRPSDLDELFKPFGCTTVSNIKQKDLKPYAFVNFETQECAAKALEEKEGTKFMGRTLHISWAGKHGQKRQVGNSRSKYSGEVSSSLMLTEMILDEGQPASHADPPDQRAEKDNL